MTIEELEDIEWLEPWHSDLSGLEAELHREVSPKHPLYGRRAIAVGRRYDCDDVLFFFPDSSPPLAVVHLTWSKETGDVFPYTQLYSSLEEWVERCMQPDHLDTEDSR